MKRLRFACAAFAAWLFVLFNIERIHEPLNLASFVYVIAAVSGVVIIAFRPLSAVALRWALCVPLAAFFLLKFSGGHSVVGTAFPMTVVEVCALAVTFAVAHQISFRLHRLEQASAGMITDAPNRQPVSLWAAQSDLYREVRRARKHDRPLSVLAVASTGDSMNPDEERLMQELKRELLEKYTNARIADLLASEAKDHGIVTHCNRHFVVLLPETDRQGAEQMVLRLDSTIKKSLGLNLRVGVSTFPDEEVTLVGLLRRAEASMHGESRDGRVGDPTNVGLQRAEASMHGESRDGRVGDPTYDGLQRAEASMHGESVERQGPSPHHKTRPATSAHTKTADVPVTVPASQSETAVDIQVGRETVAEPLSKAARVPK